MEAAGVWDNIACIIVKGVCDYADSHKRKMWQCYAAATGASAAMAFLGYWRPVGNNGIIYDEIESLQYMSLSDPANDENARRQRTTREDKSKATFYRLWEGQKQTFEEDHKDTLSFLHLRGVTLYEQAKYAEAEYLHRQVWEGRKQTLGEYHKDTLLSLDWLGQALYYQKKYALAAETYRDAWEGRKRALGENHAKTLLSRNQLRHALSKSSASTKKRKPR